ncbi:type VI secretion system baseplate subunit TssE [Methyloglobulus sp.]|uniref:type VI secretion system baseplate subunit TssE n=1 Tax=Methyloglobulus sp. TaxID=2518622 RepID=UPI00398A4D21
MARALLKERFLPSLLDRLTDDDPINTSIRIQKEKISSLEKSLAELPQEKATTKTEESQKRRSELQQQLDELRAQFSVLTASVSSLREIRACVKRDLDWLLNASQYSPQEDLDGYPDVACSVLNFGIPDLTGKTVSGFDPAHIERLMKQVIMNYEPRIIRRTLTVQVIADKVMFDHNALAFEIEGDLWAEPQPLHLHLRTEFELEDGTVSVYDYRPRENRP